MSRATMISAVGQEYLTSNVENDEFSYCLEDRNGSGVVSLW